jgi:hypothetical protein
MVAMVAAQRLHRTRCQEIGPGRSPAWQQPRRDRKRRRPGYPTRREV